MNPTVSGPWRNGEKIFKMSSIPLTYSNKNFENCDTNPLCHGQRRVTNSPWCAEYHGASQQILSNSTKSKPDGFVLRKKRGRQAHDTHV